MNTYVIMYYFHHTFTNTSWTRYHEVLRTITHTSHLKGDLVYSWGVILHTWTPLIWYHITHIVRINQLSYRKRHILKRHMNIHTYTLRERKTKKCRNSDQNIDRQSYRSYRMSYMRHWEKKTDWGRTETKQERDSYKLRHTPTERLPEPNRQTDTDRQTEK